LVYELVEIVSLAQGGADFPDFIKGLFGYSYGYCLALCHYLKRQISQFAIQCKIFYLFEFFCKFLC
jgi:hypothetical protein